MVATAPCTPTSSSQSSSQIALSQDKPADVEKAAGGSSKLSGNIFDAPGAEDPGLFRSWAWGILVASILGVFASFPFAFVGKFAPAGFRGSSRMDNMLCRIGQTINIIPSAHVWVSFVSKLSDWKWWAYYLVFDVAVFVGFRTFIEEITGRSDKYLVWYTLACILVYPGLLPIPMGLMRLAPAPHNQKWATPWRWSLRDIKQIPIKEFLTWLMAVPSAFVYIGFTVMDAFIFLNPRRAMNESVRTVVRPIVTFFVRRVCYFFFSRGFEMSRQGDVKLYGLLTIHVILQMVNVRLATSCTSVADLLAVLAFDWGIWVFRSIVFYMATAPKATKDRYPPCVRTFLYIQTFDKMTGKGLTFELGCTGPIQLHDLRRYEYLLENAALTMCYVATLIGYVWHLALDMGPDNAARAFWFPLGSVSLHYTLIAFGSELIQDFASHTLAHFAASRHPNSANFTAVWPGWLVRPSGLIKALKAVLCCLWAIGALSQFGFWLYQEGIVQAST